MKEITEFKNFETFIKEMNENFKQKKNFVEKIVSKIKDRYGGNAKEFISTVNEKGVDDLKEFIVQTVKPIDRIETKTLIADYENILLGLVSWVLLEMQLEKDK